MLAAARFRVSQWLDTSDPKAEVFPTLYGIQVSTKPREWKHVAENGKALVFDTPEEANAKIEEITRAMCEQAQGQGGAG